MASLVSEGVSRHSELGRLLDGVTRAAAIDAVARGHRHDEPTERWGRNQFDEMLTEASIPIDHIRWAVGSRGDADAGRVWGHRSFVIGDVKGKKVPEFQRQEIEQIAGSYIAGKTKSAEADRLFVDVLVALEFYQYLDSILNAPHVPIIAPHVFKRKPIMEWFVGRLISAVCGFLGYGLFWLATKVGFPESWLWIVGLILVALFFIEAIWSLIQLPRTWFVVRAAQKKIAEIIEQMNGVYASLSSSGPISAQHVTELVKKSTEAGIVWPAPLHVLLEDIVARGGRF